ncbi:class II fructose-bisphosphate aldolase [Patescibacteria group bacterium]|nr:class II fructose-bisphosphate aldolase [Patescibacteria group bacterium]
MTLADELKQAREKGVAIGHFNFSDMAGLYAIAAAARELNVPVIVGVSEGERGFTGVAEAAALVKAIAAQYNQRIYMNADHTHSLEGALAAAKAGFDSIVFDLSSLPMDQNIAQTAQAVKELKAINPAIIIEGEIGNIGSGSEVHDKAPENLGLSTVEEAVNFVKATGVDVLAPAVGNMHGILPSMLTGEVQKRLHIDRIKEISQATGLYMTLHGGSDTNDGDLVAAIKAGITVVHINTEIRVAWRKALDASLAADKDQIAPYKVFAPVQKAVEEVVKSRLKVFNQ